MTKKSKEDNLLLIIDRIYWTIIVSSVLMLIALAYRLIMVKLHK